MEFFFRYRILITVIIAVLFGSFIWINLSEKVSKDAQQIEDFFKPIRQKK